jgi:hypothetical protein
MTPSQTTQGAGEGTTTKKEPPKWAKVFGWVVVLGVPVLIVIAIAGVASGSSKSGAVHTTKTTAATPVSTTTTEPASAQPTESLEEESAKAKSNGWTGENILLVRAAYEANAHMSGPQARCAAMFMAKTYTLEAVDHFSPAEKKTAEEDAVAACNS